MAAFSGPGIGYVSVGMVVTDSKLFDRGHMIRRWADGIARNFERFVREEAPLNKRPNTGTANPPGTLKAGLFCFVEHPAPRQFITSVVSLAPHTKYVAAGTSPQIVASNLMVLPLNPGFMAAGHPTDKDIARGGTLHKVVSGQQRNQFFERAFVRTAALHPSLRPNITNAFKISR